MIIPTGLSRMKRSFLLFLSALLITGSGCTRFRLGPDPMSPEGQAKWVRETLESMDLRAQVSSLVVVAVTAGFSHVDSPERKRIESQVRDLGVGGIAMWGGDPFDEALTISRLQEIAPIPLLVATDNEWGLGMRITGSSTFPKAMALGATGDSVLAGAAGFITGQETRAIGIHMGYAPVADVNNNPLNPIISVRSFGEDPGLVSRMALAWAKGAQEAGILVTAKHFPGHGDVSVDSHIDLPVVAVSRERLEEVELAPFRALIDGGIDAVMTAHLWITAFNPDEMLPASLSPQVNRDYLRGELGFEGLIVTDALRMGAIVRHFGVEETAIRTVEAGADLLVLPADSYRSVDGIVEAVGSGRLDRELIIRAARRLLETKARLGLHLRRQVPLEGIERIVGDPETEKLAGIIAERSITVVMNKGDLLPLGTGTSPIQTAEGIYSTWTAPAAAGPFQPRDESLTDSVLFLGLSSDPGSGSVGRAFFGPLRELYPDAVHLTLYPGSGIEESSVALEAAESASLVIAAVFSRVRDEKGHAAVVEEHASLLRYLAARGTPVVVAAFGPPYFLLQFRNVNAYLAAYDYGDMAQSAAGRVVVGAVGARGRLPVSLPGLYDVGWGLSVGPAVGR